MRPHFVILPGGTATAAKLRRASDLAAAAWPDADVQVADFRGHRRGLAESGGWLDAWCRDTLPDGVPVHLLAYILGAAVLPHTREFLPRVQRAVIVRSRYQEEVPRRLRRWLGAPLLGLFAGRALAELGAASVWPTDFALPFPYEVLLETRRSRLATWLRVPPASDTELGLRSYKEFAISHDDVYESAHFMAAVVRELTP